MEGCVEKWGQKTHSLKAQGPFSPTRAKVSYSYSAAGEFGPGVRMGDLRRKALKQNAENGVG